MPPHQLPKIKLKTQKMSATIPLIWDLDINMRTKPNIIELIPLGTLSKIHLF
jgi:hypothetical protein